MGYYRPSSSPDRAKAAAAVVLVHAGLAAAILSGLQVNIGEIAVNPLKTFDIVEEVPPPPEEVPPPRPDESSAPKDEAAPANIRSRPTPVVAPTPPIPLPIEQRIRTAEVRGPEGLDRTAGASNVPGSGTGAGGSGSGFGGGGSGGTGTGSGGGGVAITRNLSNRDYRRIAGSRLPYGRAAMAIRVEPNGSVSRCRVVRSSGDQAVDSALCPLVQRRLRFRPARNSQGRPIAADVTYTATWQPN